MRTVSLLGCICQVTCIVVFPSMAFSADDWWFEVGPAVRGDMKVSVSGSSYAQQEGVHSVYNGMRTGPLAPPDGIGAQNGYADRVYNSGYVKQDSGTGNPNSLDPNTTWNWGFTPGQYARYSSSAQTLALDAVGAPGYTILQNGSASGRDDMFGAGFQAVIGRKLMESGKWSLDGCFVFQAIWGQDNRLNTSTYGEEVQKVTVTDTYNVSGIGAANFPANGYQGTFSGPFGTQAPPYPVIPNVPQTRSPATSAALATSYNSIGFDVRQSLYELGLGPQIGFQAAKWLKLHLRPTISLNIIDARIQRTEMFAGQTWLDHTTGLGARLGVGITGGADMDLGRGFYFGVAGGYEYITHSLAVEVGPNTITLDPSGWVVSCMIGRHF